MNNRPPYRHLVPAHRAVLQFDTQRFSTLNSDLVRIVSLALPLLVMFSLNGASVVGTILLAIALTALWQIWFTRSRGQTPGADLISTALLFALMLPPGFAVWQLALGISFGVVIGEQIFGGRGYSFLHPVITGLAFLLYSFPEMTSTVDHVGQSLALIPGLLLLLFYRLIDWRVLLSLVIGAVSMYLIAFNSLPTVFPTSMVLSGILFAALDPAVGASTRNGRWVYGLLIGVLIVLFDPTLQSLQSIVFACLLGSVAAPLIDALVVRFKTRQINRRHRHTQNGN